MIAISLKSITLGAPLLLAATLAQASGRPAQAVDTEPYYEPGSQYTATLDQTRNQWRLQPLSGQDVIIHTGACATGAMVPAGVWLLVLDQAGQPELLAPSATPLPGGSSDRVALRACHQASGAQLAVPQIVLDLLKNSTGAVYVNR